MELLNWSFGIITIASFLFGVWSHVKARQERQLDQERAAGLARRISDATGLLIAIRSQLELAIFLSRRENITASELRHLMYSTRLSLVSAASMLLGEADHLRNWIGEVAGNYVIQPLPDGEERESTSSMQEVTEDVASGSDKS